MQTKDVDLFFASDADQKRAAERRSKASKKPAGEPLRLSTKPLAIRVEGNDIWVAESGFTVKRISLKTGKTRQIFKGHTGPVNCLQLVGTAGQSTVLVTGSWDKSVIFWDTTTKEILTRIDKAHTDFVKSLLYIPELELLVSGGSDKDIRIWEVSRLLAKGSANTEPPEFLGSLREHTRPVDCLQYRYVSENTVVLFSADSMGKMCCWKIDKTGDKIQTSLLYHWRPHETAICDLVIGPKQIWTASADSTVCLSLYEDESYGKPPRPRYRIKHPYYVKSILVLPVIAPDLAERSLITGSTDEAIRVYDLDENDMATPVSHPWQNDVSSGREIYEQGLGRVVDEHFHEVNGLALWHNTEAERAEDEFYVISASLDGTIRRWRLPPLLDTNHPWPLNTPQDDTPADEQEKEAESLMTAEEEAELAELMAD